MLLSKDQPLMRHVQPRGQAAIALLNLGEPDKAQKLIDECVREYPESALTKLLVERVTVDVRRKHLHDALETALTVLADDAPPAARQILGILPHWAATRGVANRLSVRMLNYAVNALDFQPGTLSQDFERGGARVDLQDALNFADARKQQLLSYTQVTPRKASTRFMPRKLKLAFYSPHAIDRWIPRDLLTRGLGGSESSLVYLARELSKQGITVETYTPHTDGEGRQSLWSGEHEGQEFCVIQKDLVHMAQAVDADIIVTCRAPYLVRENAGFWQKPIYCWHQDNGYGNPWLWSPEVANAHAGHLHVSEWARRGLLGELVSQKASVEVDAAKHSVLGNGVPVECPRFWDNVERKPRRVIYASDPTRGLEKLLDAWPAVRKEIPDAELLLNLGFGVMLALRADMPGSPVAQRISAMKDRCAAMTKDGVAYTGWAPQHEVMAAMKMSSVYCYPGGPMPEGFGVALAQAQASGCTVLAPASGAIPTVLGDWYWPLEEEKLVEQLVDALKSPTSVDTRQLASAWTLEQHAWPVVAKRFLKLIGA